MAPALKIDSNVTGLRIAEELSIRTLPNNPIWEPQEPNSYKDMGGENKLVARRPINDGRQRQKGVITDLDAMGGYEADLTAKNLQTIIQGAMYASFRDKGTNKYRAPFSSTFTANAGTDEITITNHGLDTGMGPYTVSNSGGALPAGLAAVTNYWIVRTGANTFKFATSRANAIATVPTVVDITSAGTGTQTMVNAQAVTGGTNKYTINNVVGTIVTNSLVFASGFNTAANNGLKLVTAATQPDITVSTALTTEANPPYGAQVSVVGVQGGSADLNVDIATGPLPRITSTTLNFTTLGLVPGEWIFVGDDNAPFQFVNAVNNGWKRIKTIAATYLELDKSDTTMVAETGTGLTIRLFFGRVIRNEPANLQVRRTYQLEQTLGAPDDASPALIQSQYITGSVLDEIQLNIPTANKATFEASFNGCDNELRTAAQGVKTGLRPTLVSDVAFNTSSDISRIKLNVISPTNANPTALFAYLTGLKIMIKNNTSMNKAVGTLGSFDITAGLFEVSATLDAYFADVSAITAVKNNSDMTLDCIIVKANKGMTIDLPYAALGDGKPDVNLDDPIKIPLKLEAADASPYNVNMNHTLLMSFYDYVPNAAG